METTATFKNTNWTERNYETSNIVACALEADEFRPNPIPSAVYGTWASVDCSILKGLTPLFLQGGVRYYGYL